MARNVKNIAIIAHVDHGKTTLVDQLLLQTGAFSKHKAVKDRVMDSDQLEQERGITILSKNCSIFYSECHINIIDTPGHADFGGEVERVLSMVDSVLLLVDAVEGPMPQTTFVTKKALSLGLKPIVVVNKVDRAHARVDWVVNSTFDLFYKLGATEEQLDFTVIYTSALLGWSAKSMESPRKNMTPLLDLIVHEVNGIDYCAGEDLQLQICSLDYSSFVGRIGIGRINKGHIEPGHSYWIFKNPDNAPQIAKVNEILKFEGLERTATKKAVAGDIVLITGIEDIKIGDTLCNIDKPDPLPLLRVDEPTLTMNFMVNTSPLAGIDGKFITSRQIRDRLNKELQTNVALKVDFKDDSEVFVVSGRGELHLTILLEKMRREGYEVAVGRPKVVTKVINLVKHEPYEVLAMDLEESHQGAIMDDLGKRRGELLDMVVFENIKRVRLEYRVPSINLIGFQSNFLSMTKGTGIMSHTFESFAPIQDIRKISQRKGVLVSQASGIAVGYALWKLQERGRMFIRPGDAVYEGMIIGENSRENDLVVNPIKTKQLTNIRASGKDDAIALSPPINLSLEKAISFIANDEWIEITPKNVRLRKIYLKEFERKRRKNDFN